MGDLLERKVGICECCGADILEYDNYSYVDGDLICEDCLEDE